MAGSSAISAPLLASTSRVIVIAATSNWLNHSASSASTSDPAPAQS
ncbi:hypothetical protein [Microbacterium maritypicum]